MLWRRKWNDGEFEGERDVDEWDGEDQSSEGTVSEEVIT
jgi:hypothetical protein